MESERGGDSYHQLLKKFEHENIRFLGLRKDSRLLLSVSKVYVLSSHREGLLR
ncbi:MAG: hypothetical protein R3250_00400 [Melioribacteraceae bacterium]|nr:hypothetical protein [Melioribacteraceae bacterium]